MSRLKRPRAEATLVGRPAQQAVRANLVIGHEDATLTYRELRVNHPDADRLPNASRNCVGVSVDGGLPRLLLLSHPGSGDHPTAVTKAFRGRGRVPTLINARPGHARTSTPRPRSR